MPFLNSLVDPYGVLARGTYGEDNDEDWRNRRPTQRVSAAAAPTPPSGGAGDTRRGGGGGGAFLASLAQMGPLIAQIFQSTATGDSIQRALADHASTMERYNESRRLQAERAAERSFAAEQSDLDRTARKQEREDERAFRTNLFDREQAAAEERDNRRIAADAASTQEERAYRERIAAQEKANGFRQSMVGAIQFGGADGAQVERWAQEYEQTGVIPPQALEAQARAQRAEEAARRQSEFAKRQDRQPTELELRQAYAQQQYDDLLAEYKAIPSESKLGVSPQQFMESQLGPQAYQMMQAAKLGYEVTPPEPPSEAEVTQRILSNPNDPDRKALVDSLDTMPAGQFDARVQQLARQAPDPDVFLANLERSLTNPEHKAVLRRLRGQRPTRGGNLLDIAGDTIAGAASDVGSILRNDPIIGAPGRGLNSLLSWLSQPQ